MKKVLYPILVIIVFLVMQVVGALVMAAVAFAKNSDVFMTLAKSGNQEAFMSYFMMGDALAWGLIVSDILMIGILALLRLVDWKYVVNFKMIDWKTGLFAIVGAVCLIFYSDILSEMLDLPDDMSKIFTGMSLSVVGALSIGVIGPIAEEFVFREALLGSMLRGGMNKWVAITASALVFGIIHWNPAQIPFATIIGFVFGVIYYKTGNIVIPSILHIVNNSTAVVMMVMMGEEAEEAQLSDFLGGPAMASGICIPIIVIGISWLKAFWQKYQSERFVDTPTASVELSEATEIVESSEIIESTEQTNQIPNNNETVL